MVIPLLKYGHTPTKIWLKTIKKLLIAFTRFRIVYMIADVFKVFVMLCPEKLPLEQML